MSATITDEESDLSCGGVGKRRKVAILMAFCGVGYKGMQRNPGFKTIEGELEEAFFLAGAVPESERGKPKLYDFARSARTDKGVSAVGQVISGYFNINPPGLVNRLNSILPEQIKVFGYKRVTTSFSSKKMCDGRRYVYLIPLFALDTMSHRDREAVMASLGSGEEYVKCVECSERGRKIPGANCYDSKSLESNFCYGEKEKERFNRILSHYVGLYNFHNFTTRMKPDDPAANRCIISFTVNSIVTLDEIEFIKCEVMGKSFMLHQIRKMMGLAVAIMRNCASESLIRTAFSKDVNITVPMAPEVGLYLDECFFTSYNKNCEDSHEEVSLDAYKEEAEAFKLKYIYSHIGSAERRYGSVALWLHSLNYRNYPDLNFGGSRHNIEQVLLYNKNDEIKDPIEPEQVIVSDSLAS